MYSLVGTHATEDMSPEQAAAASRWEKPAMFAALFVIPYLVLRFFLHGKYGVVSDVLQYGLWLFFLVEAVSMLRLAPSNVTWVKENLLDIALLVVTFPLSSFLPESFEVFQVLWLLRILDLLPVVHRYFFRITVLRFSFILLALTIFGAGMAFGIVEHAQHLSFVQTIYWASTTVSTVGYGDMLPHTNAGMVLAMVTQISGLVIAAIFVAGVLPLFDREFAEGFSSGAERMVARVASDVDALEDAMQTVKASDVAQDRVLARMAEQQAEVLHLLTEQQNPAIVDRDDNIRKRY